MRLLSANLRSLHGTTTRPGRGGVDTPMALQLNVPTHCIICSSVKIAELVPSGNI
jgi:hypothetical protein